MESVNIIPFEIFVQGCNQLEIDGIDGALQRAGVVLTSANGAVKCPCEHLHPDDADIEAFVQVDLNRLLIPSIACSCSACDAVLAETNQRIFEEYFGISSHASSSPEPAPVNLPVLAAVVNSHPWSKQQIISDPGGLVTDPFHLQHIYGLALFDSGDSVWTGHTKYDAGDPKWSCRFQTPTKWYNDPTLGHLICPTAFKPGSFRRDYASHSALRYFIVRSEDLTEAELCCVIRWFEDTGYTLRAVVETPGASLEAWFERPGKRSNLGKHLKAYLDALQCDTEMLTAGATCRLPGVPDGMLHQTLIYYKP